MNRTDKTTRKNRGRGFTLIELMVVLVIIGVFAAVAIPGIMEVRHRNRLIEFTNQIQQIIVQTRAVAMQTRRAAEVVVALPSGATSPTLTINGLSGPDCRTTQVARAGLFETAFDTGDQRFWGSGVDIMNAYYIDPGQSCGSPAWISDRSSFTVCYSGHGDLWISNGVRGASPTWIRPCSLTQNPGSPNPGIEITLANGGKLRMTDGFVLVFNRKNGNDWVDVNRFVVLPTNGAAFQELGVE